MKTFKTGGTSVEIYFERYCTDPDREFQEREERKTEISKWGIIAGRGQSSLLDRTWYNHMPAERVLQLIGPQLWNEYYKFCVFRNPFDKIVSSFWHNLQDTVRLDLQHATFDAVRECFQDWVRTADHPSDLNVFTIRGQPAMDRFVRYEDLQNELAAVCGHLGLPWDPSRLGRYKSGTRVRDEPFKHYYDRSAADVVRELYKWEFEYFRYDEP